MDPLPFFPLIEARGDVNVSNRLLVGRDSYCFGNEACIIFYFMYK